MAVHFHVVLEDDGLYPMILGRLWFSKVHIQN